MSDIVLHNATKRTIEAYIAKPGHALAIVAPAGSGKTAIANYIVQRLLNLSTAQLESYAYYRLIASEKGAISIEQAREIVALLKLKTTGTGVIRRVVVIEHAHTMTLEAQNALLKAIEEPPADTVMILTVADETKLLPTVRSRVQAIKLIAPSEVALRTHFAMLGHAQNDIDKALLLSGGLTGLMKALLDGATDHELVAAIETTKGILVGDMFTRLVKVDELARQKQIDMLLFAFGRIAQSGIQAAAKTGNPGALRRWHKVLAATQEAQELLVTNTQAKLVLTNLMLKV